MRDILLIEQVRELERQADADGLGYAQMMENAASAAAARVMAVLERMHILTEDAAEPATRRARITVLVGPGKNGGDGLVAARILAQDPRLLVRAYLLKPRPETDELLMAARAASVSIADADNDLRYRVLTQMIASAHIVLDALFGIGVTLPLRDDASKLLRAVKQALAQQAGPPLPYTDATATYPLPAIPFLIAIDCPSGVNCDTGEIDAHTLAADETITFIAAKPGLLLSPALNAVGTLLVADIGLPNPAARRPPPARLMEAKDARALLPPRPIDGNKGTFGTAMIIGGAAAYYGAPVLAAHAAYRAGAGLVRVAAGAPIVSTMAGQLPEAIWQPLAEEAGALPASAFEELKATARQADALAIGVGMGQADTTRELLLALLAADAVHAPLVLDADALNLLSTVESWPARLPADRVILTPHPGEMSRLSGIPTEQVNSERLSLAREKAAAWGVTLLLKGAHTLIASPEGQVRVLPFKNSGMATGGAGDVLTGIIAGLLAQGMMPFPAAVLGGYLHGLAGEIAARHKNARSLMAGDIIEAIGAAYAALEGAR